MRIGHAGYMPKAGGVFTGDITMSGADILLGANKLKTTNLYLKEHDVTNWAFRRSSDDSYIGIKFLHGIFVSYLGSDTNGALIKASNTNAHYLAGQARDTDVGLVETDRRVGAADPYFQATLPMVLKPAAQPGAPVEGHLLYNATPNRLQFRDAAAFQQLSCNLIGAFGILAFGSGGAMTADATRYLGAYGAAELATEDMRTQIVIPVAGTIKNLYCESVAPDDTKTITFTVRVNGVDKTLTCVITGTGTTAYDITNTEAVAVGDKVSIKAVTTTIGSNKFVRACLAIV